MYITYIYIYNIHIYIYIIYVSYDFDLLGSIGHILLHYYLGCPLHHPPDRWIVGRMERSPSNSACDIPGLVICYIVIVNGD